MRCPIKDVLYWCGFGKTDCPETSWICGPNDLEEIQFGALDR
jgi:hypothetical protein